MFEVRIMECQHFGHRMSEGCADFEWGVSSLEARYVGFENFQCI